MATEEKEEVGRIGGELKEAQRLVKRLLPRMGEVDAEGVEDLLSSLILAAKRAAALADDGFKRGVEGLSTDGIEGCASALSAATEAFEAIMQHGPMVATLPVKDDPSE